MPKSHHDQPARPNPMPQRAIGQHGIVGNLDTAALVAKDGTIDFLCWPHLDSPTIFAALLDPDKGGAFEIAPLLDDARAMQLYLPGTNILMTRWLAEDGSVELTDLMPHPDAKGSTQCCLIRRVRAVRGRMTIDVRCSPRFDYARETPSAAASDGGVTFTGANLTLRLSSSVDLDTGKSGAHARFELAAGEEAWFVLADADTPAIDSDQVAASIDNTAEAWRVWSRRCNYVGRWREQVIRSALALKLLVSHEHGSIAAAATFGLPEATGAGRNWDYRASWIRDASFTIYAFMRLGQIDEAERFRQWIGARAQEKAEGEQLRIMYRLDGGEMFDETMLDHLAGYGGAQPVRIGNAAHDQQQLDIFGEALDSLYLSNKYGTAVSHDAWQSIETVVNYVADHWQQEDAGIWEIRDTPRAFTHSRLMCWVAIDRMIRLAQKRSLPAPIDRWIQARDDIAADIWSHCRHPDKGHFVQAKGSRDVDAALLMMPLMRFVSATDPVWLATMDAIRDELSEDGMIFRYRNADGLKGGEGAFTACTFWYVECLARAGRIDEAELMMEKGLAHANHLGLFSEELDRHGRQLGNFPQGLAHLALISAAYFLDRRLDHPDGGTWQP
jgi:GH15 family glucan-1,4-alpha-glucosidase